MWQCEHEKRGIRPLFCCTLQKRQTRHVRKRCDGRGTNPRVCKGITVKRRLLLCPFDLAQKQREPLFFRKHSRRHDSSGRW